MNQPLAIALKEITETRRLLALLIKSSEGFDYPTAKLALCELDKKMRRLARVETELTAMTSTPPNVQKISFESR